MDILEHTLIAAKEHWFILSCLFLVFVIYWHYVTTYTQLKDLGLPGPSPLPIIGNFGRVMRNINSMHELQRKDLKTYGKVYGVYFLKTPIIAVSDPEILKVILVKEFEKFHDRPVCS